MKKTLCGIGVVVLVLLGTGSSAVVPTIDGNRLLRDCNNTIRALEGSGGSVETLASASFCIGYVTGILEMHAFSSLIEKMPPLFCLPDEMEFGQAIRVIVRYLQTHPERLHVPASAHVIEALRGAFPCAPAASRPQR